VNVALVIGVGGPLLNRERLIFHPPGLAAEAADVAARAIGA
jgi:hypothetical protein